MKSLFAFRKKSMAWTDKRAKLLQELLGGMRIVKLMAWEVPFLDRLGEIRRNELRYIRSLLNYRSGMSTCVCDQTDKQWPLLYLSRPLLPFSPLLPTPW